MGTRSLYAIVYTDPATGEQSVDGKSYCSSLRVYLKKSTAVSALKNSWARDNPNYSVVRTDVNWEDV